MPIYYQNHQKVIELGKGDVCFIQGIAPQLTQGGECIHKELMFLRDGQENEIGTLMPEDRWQEEFLSKPVEEWDVPVKIVFKKPESILALIESLQELYELEVEEDK